MNQITNIAISPDHQGQHNSPKPRFSGRWLQIARFAWTSLAVGAFILFFMSFPGYISRILTGVPGHGIVENTSNGFIIFQTANTLISLASGILSLTLAVILYHHKFENPAVAAVSLYLLLYGVVMTGPLEAWGWYWLGNTDFAVNVQSILMATPTVALLVLFPNGRFVPDWTRWLLILSIPWNMLALFFPVSTGNIFGLVILGSLWIMLLGLGLYAQIFRFRRVSSLEERQQTKWVLFGFALWLGYIIISTYPYFYLESMPPDSPRPWWASLSELGWWASLNIIPVTMAVAITRSRLWNIDIVINRTLVYGALTITTMAVYIIVVGTLGNLLHIGDNTFIAFLTTGLVAVIFQPLRGNLQRWVNRLMYGERDDPVAVITKLGEQIESTGSPSEILSGIVETVANTLKLPYVAIELGERNQIAASYGIPVNEVLRFPLVYQGETEGSFVVARRARGESFSLKEVQLIENIARQAGAAAHNARLTTDLQRAHQQLLTAREEERRRIRRDLHDGLGPQLASQTLTLTAARRIYKENPAKADTLLAEAIKHAQSATDDIRRVAHDLRPPALDDLGLIGALKNQIDQFSFSNIKITLETPENLPSLPAAVEAACYMIYQEALNNITRHAQASLCTVSLTLDKRICLRIGDNGKGVQENHRPGIGLGSMRQRTEELGGRFTFKSTPGNGTFLKACFPLENIEE
jgi:signal transduction histidine kinase